jgi:exonuclease VII large subunit
MKVVQFDVQCLEMLTLRLKFSPKNGDKCILTGQVSIYAARGDYQLIAKSMRLAGAGDLMQQFEMLKNKLDTEGLFDLTKKMLFQDSQNIFVLLPPHQQLPFRIFFPRLKEGVLLLIFL